MPRSNLAFTLIELLVVITIIVVLLALLVPAMDKAIYQASLVVCGANLDAVGGGVTTYAFDHKRNYPYRKLVHDWAETGYEISPMNLYAGSATGVNAFDDRIPLQGYVLINKMLNDPLCEEVDMEELANPAGSYNVYSSYARWYGWKFDAVGGGRGMNKVGDRFGWDGETYSVLVGDYSRDRLKGYEAGSHPDKRGTWGNTVWQDTDNPWSGGSPGALSGYVTWSFWGSGAQRGPIDLNFSMADGSVRRFNDVVELENAGLRGVPTLCRNEDDDRRISVPVN